MSSAFQRERVRKRSAKRAPGSGGRADAGKYASINTGGFVNGEGEVR